MIKFFPWELAFLGQMKKGKKTCKQILNRQTSLPDLIRLWAVAWLAFWRRYVCLCFCASVRVSLSAASFHLYLCTHCCFSLCLRCTVNWQFWSGTGTFAVPLQMNSEMMFDYLKLLLSLHRSELVPPKDTSKIAAERYFSTQSQPTGASNTASFKHFKRNVLHWAAPHKYVLLHYVRRRHDMR